MTVAKDGLSGSDRNLGEFSVAAVGNVGSHGRVALVRKNPFSTMPLASDSLLRNLRNYVPTYHYSPPRQRVVYYYPSPVVVCRPPVVVQPNGYGTPFIPAYGQVIVTFSELNMRSGPGPDRAVTGKVRKGDILAVVDSIPNWFYVRLPDGRYGWVMDYLCRGKEQAIDIYQYIPYFGTSLIKEVSLCKRIRA